MPRPPSLLGRRAAALAVAALLGSAIVALPAQAPADPLVATTVTLSGPNTLVSGQTLTITATVTPADPSPGDVTGTVTFYIDGVAQSPVEPPFITNPDPTKVPIYDGVVVAPIVGITAGTHELTATYSGSGLYQGATSDNFQLVVGSTGTLISLQANTSSDGTLLSINAFIQGAPPGGGTATGQAQLSVDGTPSGTPQPDVIPGFWLWELNLPPGTAHTISVSYLGSADFQPAAQS
ncbi:MAG: Ig-like domain-containing protein, partial [Actinomycetota bacterium]